MDGGLMGRVLHGTWEEGRSPRLRGTAGEVLAIVTPMFEQDTPSRFVWCWTSVAVRNYSGNSLCRIAAQMTAERSLLDTGWKVGSDGRFQEW